MFEHPEHQFLYEAAKEQLRCYPGSSLLEIGCFKGESTKALALAANELGSKVVAIDPFYGHYDESLQKLLAKDGLGESSWVQFCRNLGKLRDVVIPIATTRDKASWLLTQKLFSFCFIDGWHSVEAFVGDLEFCNQVTITGGIILCHDANWYDLGNAAVDFAKAHSYPYSFELGQYPEAPFCKILCSG